MVIISLNYIIPIEVKIFAGDQNGQCFEYSKIRQNSDLYFLTLDGRLPYENSAEGLPAIIHDDEIVGYEGVSTISFGVDIMNWISKCLALPETIKIAPIREILLQFKDVLGKLIGIMEGGEKMEITSAILASMESMKSALDIEKALPAAKSTVMKNLLARLMRQFESSGYKIIEYYEENIDKYYTQRAKTFPGFSVEVSTIGKTALAFYVMVDWYFIYGFSVAEYSSDKWPLWTEIAKFKKKYPIEYKAYMKAVESVLGRGEKPGYDYSIYWNYIANDRKERFEFKNFSEACVRLIHDFEKQAEHIYKELDAHIKVIVKAIENGMEDV